MTLSLFLTVIAAIAGTLVFIAGYIKGIRRAIAEYGTPETQVVDKGGSYWLTVFIAIFGAGVAVILLGVSSAWMIVIPFLGIFSATMVGLCFFIEEFEQDRKADRN